MIEVALYGNGNAKIINVDEVSTCEIERSYSKRVMKFSMKNGETFEAYLNEKIIERLRGGNDECR